MAKHTRLSTVPLTHEERLQIIYAPMPKVYYTPGKIWAGVGTIFSEQTQELGSRRIVGTRKRRRVESDDDNDNWGERLSDNMRKYEQCL